MNLLLLLALQIALSVSPSVARPDPKLTPGAIRTTDAHEICAKDFRTRPFRKTTAEMKDQVYREYGVTRNQGRCQGGCEVDHLVPLEIGGLDDIKNLWPQPSQPKPGFHEKDKLENQLKVLVCSGKLPLAQAQHEIVTDWPAAYEKYIGPLPTPESSREQSSKTLGSHGATDHGDAPSSPPSPAKPHLQSATPH